MSRGITRVILDNRAASSYLEIMAAMISRAFSTACRGLIRLEIVFSIISWSCSETLAYSGIAGLALALCKSFEILYENQAFSGSMV